MTRYLFTYRSVPGYDWFGDPAGLREWQSFLEAIETAMVEPGWPSFEPTALIGETGQWTQVGGYSVVTADSLEEAAAMATGCPTVTRGGGVEVAVLAELPPEHPAERIRRQLAKA
ncbi:MAG TPA: YciI family protein [Acidimicrobiales bacterium]|nr:YciI family protein [Acidimicrobiales bacterium]